MWVLLVSTIDESNSERLFWLAESKQSIELSDLLSEHRSKQLNTICLYLLKSPTGALQTGGYEQIRTQLPACKAPGKELPLRELTRLNHSWMSDTTDALSGGGGTYGIRLHGLRRNQVALALEKITTIIHNVEYNITGYICIGPLQL